MKRPPSRRDRGFTLIEVLLVLVILVVLASLATVNILSSQRKAKINSAKVQVELLDKALQTYYLDVGTFPSQSVGLHTNDSSYGLPSMSTGVICPATPSKFLLN